jgi:hypothetical protein
MDSRLVPTDTGGEDQEDMGGTIEESESPEG